MKNRNLHPESPCSFPCRSLKKMVPGVVLALLTTPVLAAEQKQSNELTLVEAWMLRPTIRVRIKVVSPLPW